MQAINVQEESMQISAQQVKELRERTGLGLMECKSALKEAAGDLEEAEKVLRKKGMAATAKRAGRTAAEGLVGSYIHVGAYEPFEIGRAHV